MLIYQPILEYRRGLQARLPPLDFQIIAHSLCVREMYRHIINPACFFVMELPQIHERVGAGGSVSVSFYYTINITAEG